MTSDITDISNHCNIRRLLIELKYINCMIIAGISGNAILYDQYKNCDHVNSGIGALYCINIYLDLGCMFTYYYHRLRCNS